MNTFKIITTIILVISLILAVGCNKSPVDPGPNPTPDPGPGPNPDPDPDPDGTVNERLVGDWMFTAATVNGSSASLADVLDWEDATYVAAFRITGGGEYLYLEFDSDIELTFASEGTISTSGDGFKISTPDVSYSGTWRVSGTVLTLTTTVDSEKIKLTAERLQDRAVANAMAR